MTQDSSHNPVFPCICTALILSPPNTFATSYCVLCLCVSLISPATIQLLRKAPSLIHLFIPTVPKFWFCIYLALNTLFYWHFKKIYLSIKEYLENTVKVNNNNNNKWITACSSKNTRNDLLKYYPPFTFLLFVAILI